MLLFLLVLGAAVCSSAVVSAQGMGPSCPDPFSARAFSPLLLFANPEDVSQIFAGGLPSEFWRLFACARAACGQIILTQSATSCLSCISGFGHSLSCLHAQMPSHQDLVSLKYVARPIIVLGVEQHLLR